VRVNSGGIGAIKFWPQVDLKPQAANPKPWTPEAETQTEHQTP